MWEKWELTCENRPHKNSKLVWKISPKIFINLNLGCEVFLWTRLKLVMMFVSCEEPGCVDQFWSEVNKWVDVSPLKMTVLCGAWMKLKKWKANNMKYLCRWKNKRNYLKNRSTKTAKTVINLYIFLNNKLSRRKQVSGFGIDSESPSWLPSK